MKDNTGVDMIEKIIGRVPEIKTLTAMLKSSKSEFLAIYGRRRIGKTFLMRNFFEKEDVVFFNITGTRRGSLSHQLSHFIKRVGDVFYHGAQLKPSKNWSEAFETLTNALNTVENKKIVLFFDEFPWMVTKNSKLLEYLDFYWNQYWSVLGKVKLVICGSSASWIIDKIVNNKGGLHNRLTRHINLEPFNLKETEEYLIHSKIKLSREQILRIYMAIGGVPYYLEKLEKGLSAVQNIEQLAFTKKSFLLEEFNNLFSSLFENYEEDIEILRLIAKNRYGIGQEELLRRMGKSLQGKTGLRRLKMLQDASFITSFKPHLHSKKGIFYKVIDEYVLFYFYWIEPVKDSLLEKGLIKGYWERKSTTAEWYSWAGYTFEAVCYKHIAQISAALNMSPTAIPSAWRYVPQTGEDGAQIDLLFDREDNAMTICEMKYTEQPFAIKKLYAKQLEDKIKIFQKVTRIKKQIFLAIISANGMKETLYSEMVDSLVTLDDLFMGG